MTPCVVKPAARIPGKLDCAGQKILYMRLIKFLPAISLLVFCCSAKAQNFALSTNMLGYADFLTLNVEASCGVSRHWSVSAGFRYNPFTFGKGENAVQRRQRSANTGARYWPWHVYSGWWFSADLRYQEYNMGDLRSSMTSEGERFGAGMGGGYAYMLTRNLNLDFGLSFWSGYDRYAEYDCRTCGKVTGRGGRFFVLPADIVIALTYIF